MVRVTRIHTLSISGSNLPAYDNATSAVNTAVCQVTTETRLMELSNQKLKERRVMATKKKLS